MSVTINGTAYDLTYVNVGSDFVEQPGAVLGVDPWGMDSITRRWTGRLDKVTEALAVYKRSRKVRDSVYRDLYAVEWDMTHDAPFPTLTVTFKGITDGKAPDPLVKTGKRAASATLPYTGSDGSLDGTSTTIKYYSPYYTAMYVTKTRPKTAKFRDSVDTSIEVISMSGDDSRSLQFKRAATGGTALLKTSSAYNGIVEVSTPQFDVVPVGQWFEVTETNEAILVPAGLTRAKRIVRAA